MKRIFTFALIAVSLFGAETAPTEAAIQLAYWQAAARATAAQAALRDSMSDQQKQMERQRDAFGAQAEAARKQMEALCAAKGQALDAEGFACKVKPSPAPASPAKEEAK